MLSRNGAAWSFKLVRRWAYGSTKGLSGRRIFLCIASLRGPGAPGPPSGGGLTTPQVVTELFADVVNWSVAAA